MTTKELTLYAMREQGKKLATDFRARAIEKELDGTTVIANEALVPEWRQGKYETVGAPVQYKGQLYKVWQSHDSTSNPDWNPADAVSLFDIYHTKDPAKAKPYMAPQGTRGVYATGEAMIWTDGAVYISTMDANDKTPENYPQGWEKYEAEEA